MMKNKGNGFESAPFPASPEQELRRRAEELFLKKNIQASENFEAMSSEQVRKMLHDLHVHQIELEMRNEELQRSQVELKAITERYFELYDLAPVGYCVVTERGLIAEANLTIATLWGVDQSSLPGQSFNRFIFAEDQDTYSLRRKQLLETGEPQTFELRMLKNDESVFWAQLTATAAQDEDGTPVCRIAMSDRPERKLLETYKEISREVLLILNESGDFRDSIQRILTVLKTRIGVDAAGIRLQDGNDFPYFLQDGFPEDFLLAENTLLEHNTDGGMCRDKDGNVRLACTCGLVISGRTDPANPLFTQVGSCWLNDSFRLLDIPPSADLRFHPRNRCIHHGYTSVALVPIRSKDRIVGLIQLNDRRKGRFTLDTIELLEGIASHIGAAFKYKQDEDVLRESAERFRSIVENSSAGYFFIDREGHFKSVNTAWLHLHKYDSQEEILGHHYAETQVDSDLAHANEIVKQVLTGEVVNQGEFTRRCKDNTIAWHTFSVNPVWQGGEVVGLEGFLIDITERKRAEDALQESEEKVRKKLQAILEPEGDIGTLELADIMDRHALQAMMEEFYRLTKIGIGILDVHGNVLVGVGWQDICTKFHRSHPDTLKNCIESDTELTRGIPAGSTKAYHCKNNLWDIMTPIEVGGRHLGNVCLGQFFYEDESPDYSQFRAQARKYGFDEADYLAALDRVPRWSKETVDATMAFYASLSKMISSLSYSTVKLARALSQKDAALRQLDESKAFQDSLLETIPIPVFYKDIEGRYLGMNRACEDFFGKSKEEFIGKNVFDTHPPELARIYHAKDAELFEKQGTQIYESKIMNARGGLHDVIFNKASLTDTSGSIIGLIGAIMDITARKQAETSLRLSEERLQLTLNTSQIGIWDWDIKRDTWYASPIYYSMLGYDAARGPADRSEWMERVHPEDRDAVAQKIATVLQGGVSIYQYEARMRHADGSYRWHSVIGHAIEWDDEKKPTRLIGVRIDITERKLAEEENTKLQAQLQQAKKIEAVGQLAGGVAHDFNNMLGVILGHADMALEQADPAQPIFAHLEEIRRAAERSADITRQLLAFARKQTVVPKVIDLNETIEGMLKMLRRLIGEDINLAWLPGAGLWPIKMDPSQIDQILANLCVNARAAIAGVGKIIVETGNKVVDEDFCDAHAGFMPGEYVRISVSDNGCGMDREAMDHIFEPFFTTKGVGEGTGLGLATVYGAIRQNDGFIDVYSEPGQGTTFNVYLPRYAGTTGQIKKVDAAKAIVGGHETILLVEDEPTVQKMTTAMLRRLGYIVMAATSPGEAIRLVGESAGKIDLLLTDVIMPEMNGRDLAERLVLRKPEIKCLFMSGYTADIIAKQGIVDEKVHFIQKPFSLEELSAKVRKALESETGESLPGNEAETQSV